MCYHPVWGVIFLLLYQTLKEEKYVQHLGLYSQNTNTNKIYSFTQPTPLNYFEKARVLFFIPAQELNGIVQIVK